MVIIVTGVPEREDRETGVGKTFKKERMAEKNFRFNENINLTIVK